MTRPEEPPGTPPGKPESASPYDTAPHRNPRAQLLLIPEPDLEAMARTLARSSARGVLCTQGIPEEQLSALRAGLTRPLSVRRPLHPLLAPTTTIHSRLVGDYRGKDYTVAEIGTWAGDLGLSPRYCDSVEQALDEMLLNALFAAPRSDSGIPRYSHYPPAERLLIKAPADEQAVVRFGADAKRIVISVRDRFGALRAATVLGYLIRCTESQRLRRSPLETKISGSGVGLFLITTSASELMFRLRRGRLTELVFTMYRDRPRPLRALLFDDDVTAPFVPKNV